MQRVGGLSGWRIVQLKDKRLIRTASSPDKTDTAAGCREEGGAVKTDHYGDTLVSVIIPSYNHARFIPQAILSVVNQSHENIELIIVDDGSTDDSVSVINDVLSCTGRFRTELVVQENRGAHEAINRGISMAKGTYISILNSDDFYYPDRITRLLNKAVPDKCEFVFSMVDHCSSEGYSLGRDNPVRSEYLSMLELIQEFPSLGFALLNYNLTVSTSNFFIKQSLVNTVGMFKNYKIVHDWDYVLRVLLEIEPCLVTEPLMGYRVHKDSTLARLLPVSGDECVSVMGNYFDSMLKTKSHNPVAPAPYNWPDYFGPFVHTYPKKFNLKLSDIMRMYASSPELKNPERIGGRIKWIRRRVG